MNINELLLNINDVKPADVVRQTEVQTVADKDKYGALGYSIQLTEQEFRSKFPDIDPAHICYTKSLSQSSFYYNAETFAVVNLNVDMMLANEVLRDQAARAVQIQEERAAQTDYMGSALALPDGLRVDYLSRIVHSKGADVPNLHKLFWDVYTTTDYGFHLDEEVLRIVTKCCTSEERARIERELTEHFGDSNVVRVYRGGNSASTPWKQAFSWTTDINIAKFFATRRGTEEGYIVEGSVGVKHIINAFLDDNKEQEIIVHPEYVTVTNVIPVHGMEFIEETLPDIIPMYQQYRDSMDDLDFAIDSKIHGKAHEARVLLLCLTLAEMLGLGRDDRRVLAEAAVFHDTRRTNDGRDEVHGLYSALYYRNAVRKPDPFVEFLCEYHSRPDDKMEYGIAKSRALRNNSARAELLYKVFKDADALDRVRLGAHNLDMKQLRLPESMSLPLVAKIYLEQIEV